MHSIPGTDRHLRRLDVALVGLGAALTLVTLWLLAAPDVTGRAIAPLLDVAINVAATLVGGAVSILAWIRWRETGGVGALYESSAFVVLTSTNGVALGLVLAGRGDVFGLDPAQPAAAPVYLWTITRILAAALLVAGAVRGLRRASQPSHPLRIAIAPAVGLLVLAVALTAAVPIAQHDIGGGDVLAGERTIVATLQVVAFALYMGAAVLFRRLFSRDRLVSHAFLAAGLVVAAFSQLHFAINPIVGSGTVTTGDVLRVVFYVILFLGVQAEVQSDLAALRVANLELVALRDVDATNATLAERARLAREIHDGLAQDLWSAKLKAARLTQDEALSAESRLLANEVLSALDVGLADARQAVMALRAQSEGQSFIEVLRRYATDFSDRFGLRPEIEVDGQLPMVSPRAEAELLRIAQEALNNVRKHANATTVWIRLRQTSDGLQLEVTDNGRGFDVERAEQAGFGLRGMRERAEIIAGHLTIKSRASDGTSVVVSVPATKGSAS